MNRIIEKPYIIFFVFALIPLLNGFNTQDSTVFNIQDTYYVISNSHLTILYSIVFGIIGLSYLFAEKVTNGLSYNLNLIHLIITFGGIAIVLILSTLKLENDEIINLRKLDFNQNMENMIYIVSALIVFGQVILPINIIRNIKKRNQTSA